MKAILAHVLALVLFGSAWLVSEDWAFAVLMLLSLGGICYGLSWCAVQVKRRIFG